MADLAHQFNDLLAQHGLPLYNPEESSLFEHMGVHMHASLWPLGVSLIKTGSVSPDAAYEFIRRAIHVVDPSDMVKFLIETSDSVQYDFLSANMLHYMAPMLCAYFITFPNDSSALYGLLRLEMLRRSPIIIEEVYYYYYYFLSGLELTTWRSRCWCDSYVSTRICLETPRCMRRTSCTAWTSPL